MSTTAARFSEFCPLFQVHTSPPDAAPVRPRLCSSVSAHSNMGLLHATYKAVVRVESHGSDGAQPASALEPVQLKPFSKSALDNLCVYFWSHHEFDMSQSDRDLAKLWLANIKHYDGVPEAMVFDLLSKAPALVRDMDVRFRETDTDTQVRNLMTAELYFSTETHGAYTGPVFAAEDSDLETRVVFLYENELANVAVEYWSDNGHVTVRFADGSACTAFLPTRFHFWKQAHPDTEYLSVQVRDYGGFQVEPWMFYHYTLTVDPGIALYTIPASRSRDFDLAVATYNRKQGRLSWLCYFLCYRTCCCF